MITRPSVTKGQTRREKEKKQIIEAAGEVVMGGPPSFERPGECPRPILALIVYWNKH